MTDIGVDAHCDATRYSRDPASGSSIASSLDGGAIMRTWRLGTPGYSGGTMLDGCSIMVEYDGGPSEQRVVIVPMDGCTVGMMRAIKTMPGRSVLAMLSGDGTGDSDDDVHSGNAALFNGLELLRPVFLEEVLGIASRDSDDASIVDRMSALTTRRGVKRVLVAGSLPDGSVVSTDLYCRAEDYGVGGDARSVGNGDSAHSDGDETPGWLRGALRGILGV